VRLARTLVGAFDVVVELAETVSPGVLEIVGRIVQVVVPIWAFFADSSHSALIPYGPRTAAAW
jgi:phage-related protein